MIQSNSSAGTDLGLDLGLGQEPQLREEAASYKVQD